MPGLVHFIFLQILLYYPWLDPIELVLLIAHFTGEKTEIQREGPNSWLTAVREK